MSKFKLTLTICLVAVLTLTMGVATFASDPLTEGGEELVKIVDTSVNPAEFFGTLSLSDYSELHFYLNGIGYKAVITDELSNLGYFVNIYNPNDIIWRGDFTVYTDDINFDYIIMPSWIWNELVNEQGYSGTGIPVESNQSILGVFSAVPGFMISIITPLITLFWANGSFTFIGVLALASLAFALILLLFTVIRKFISFRG